MPVLLVRVHFRSKSPASQACYLSLMIAKTSFNAISSSRQVRFCLPCFKSDMLWFLSLLWRWLWSHLFMPLSPKHFHVLPAPNDLFKGLKEKGKIATSDFQTFNCQLWFVIYTWHHIHYGPLYFYLQNRHGLFQNNKKYGGIFSFLSLQWHKVT